MCNCKETMNKYSIYMLNTINNDESSKVIDAFHKIPVALKQHFQVVNDN